MDRRVFLPSLVALAVLTGGCIGAVDPGQPTTQAPGAIPASTYAVEGCTLLEAVVPGDWHATEARLPAGFDPVDYGDYWGGPATGDSAISVVVFDCPTFVLDGADRSHREVLIGAYVEVARDRQPEDASPFYLFDTWTPDRAYADLLDRYGWQAPTADDVTLVRDASGHATGGMTAEEGSVSVEGAFPAGDSSTGTFAFLNYHRGRQGMVHQRLAFQDFTYRMGPTRLDVDGIAPLVGLVGEGTTEGWGYLGWEIAYDARLSLAP